MKKIGLALGGGGARGCAHVGAIRALQEAGIPIHAVAGTSMGALVGAFFASGDLQELEDRFSRIRWKDVLGYFDPVLPRQGLFEGKKVERLLQEILSCRRIEKTRIPYTAVATDLETGEEVWLNQGSLSKAVRASIALPGIFTPVRLKGRTLADGGIVNPMPVNALRKAGMDFVIAIDLNHQFIHERLKLRRRYKFPGKKVLKLFSALRPNLIEVLENAIFIMQDRITRQNLLSDAPDILLRPMLAGCSLFDFHKAREIMEAGYAAAKAEIPRIKKALGRNEVK